MTNRSTLICLSLALALSNAALADTKIVQQSHHDAFSVMGKDQPALDTERVIWVGTDRLRMDDVGASFIVRLDQQLMVIIDHQNQAMSQIELPVDLSKLLPEGVAQQMLDMLQLKVEVTPSEETKTVGPWTARRYDVVMTSSMATVKNTMWATTEVEVDRDVYYSLFHQIIALQPGMDEVLAKIQSIEGFVVEEESVTTMPMAGDAEMRSVDTTVSVETLDPPKGIYEPPADYQVKEFDLLSAMQGK